MTRTEAIIQLNDAICYAINEFFEDYDENADYSGWYLSIEKKIGPEWRNVPYMASIVPLDEADYLNMPKVTDLIEDYVDEDNGKLSVMPCVASMARFIDRWLDRNFEEKI